MVPSAAPAAMSLGNWTPRTTRETAMALAVGGLRYTPATGTLVTMLVARPSDVITTVYVPAGR